MLGEKLFLFYGIHFLHSMWRELATKLCYYPEKFPCLILLCCLEDLPLCAVLIFKIPEFEFEKGEEFGAGLGGLDLSRGCFRGFEGSSIPARIPPCRWGAWAGPFSLNSSLL